LLKNKEKRHGHWSWRRVWSKVIGCGLIKNKRNVMVIGRGNGFGQRLLVVRCIKNKRNVMVIGRGSGLVEGFWLWVA
jgi:hypothetical protein